MVSQPNEKTLELNVSSNMLDRIRVDHPNAFLYGYTMQYEEPRNGLDTSLNLPGDHRLFSFQFKKPKKQRGGIFWFKFNDSTHNLQHNIMRITADAIAPFSSVFYALPAYSNMNDFENDSPNFLPRTWLIDIQDTPLIWDYQAHEFEIDVVNRTFIIHSDEVLGEGKIYASEEILKKFYLKQIGINSSLFKIKIENYQNKDELKNEIETMKTEKTFLKALVL
jgi:hypothetical protein